GAEGTWGCGVARAAGAPPPTAAAIDVGADRSATFGQRMPIQQWFRPLPTQLIPGSDSDAARRASRSSRWRGAACYSRLMRLQNRIALVTGAGSGLGRAGALALAREGARGVGSALDPSSTDTTVATIREAGGEAVGIPADAGDRAQAKHLIDETVRRLGGLDVLYNNAGIAPVGRDGFTPNIADDDWDWVLRVNLTSVFLCCKYAIPVLAGRPGAAIINT